jgi:hypothetical protein
MHLRRCISGMAHCNVTHHIFFVCHRIIMWRLM